MAVDTSLLRVGIAAFTCHGYLPTHEIEKLAPDEVVSDQE